MQNYLWNASDYAKSSCVQQQWAHELIDKLNLNGVERVLDIGCGDGKVTAAIARGVPSGFVVGIDNSEEMIALARQLYPKLALPHLRFELVDARRLHYQNEFDIVFSNATLHWILDHQPVLQGIWTSLKHGGRMLLQMGGKGNAAEVFSAFEILCQDAVWRKYFDGFTFPYGFFGVSEYDGLLTHAGFNVHRVELIPKTMVQENRSGLEAWIRTTWLPYTQRIPEDQREVFIRQLADVYLSRHHADPDGTIRVQMVRLEVDAEKQ